ncbi:MAG: shikimate kinase [Deltaproteobacteria bacterium]|nr:shikimate kinase [Deltaproteobacteria bacterium]
MRLVLIGPRGAGKSRLARGLADAFALPRVSSDDDIARAVGCSIADYVSANGWSAFRALETEVLEIIVRDRPGDLLLDAGGGLVVPERNRELLREFDARILLTARIETLVARTAHDRARPPLTDAADPNDEMRRVLAEREPVYRSLADVTIDTSDASPEETLAKAISWIETNVGNRA